MSEPRNPETRYWWHVRRKEEAAFVAATTRAEAEAILRTLPRDPQAVTYRRLAELAEAEHAHRTRASAAA